jgi:hypothetical protein
MERHIARVAHAGRATRPTRIARVGYPCDVAERPFALRGRRPLAACMVEDASRNGGAPARRARGRRSAQGRSVACHARPVIVTRSAAAGGKMRGLECGRRGGNSGAHGTGFITWREPVRPLGPALDCCK